MLRVALRRVAKAECLAAVGDVVAPGAPINFKPGRLIVTAGSASKLRLVNALTGGMLATANVLACCSSDTLGFMRVMRN